MSNHDPDPVAALAALAHEQRLAIFRLLVQAGPEGLAAGAIAEALQSPASSISFHLANLTRAGMIAQRRESRSLIYATDYAGFQALIAYLVEDCCGGRPEICAPLAKFGTCAPSVDVRKSA